MLLLAMSIGCSSQADRPTDVDSLVEALEARGLEVRQLKPAELTSPLGSRGSAPLGRPTVVLRVEDAYLQVLALGENEPTEPPPVVLGQVSVDMPRPHLWQSERMFVLFEGGNSSLAETLSSILGKPTLAPVWAPDLADS